MEKTSFYHQTLFWLSKLNKASWQKHLLEELPLCWGFCQYRSVFHSVFPPQPPVSHLPSISLADRTAGQGSVVLASCKMIIIRFYFSNPCRALLSLPGAVVGQGETWEGFSEPFCGPGGWELNLNPLQTFQ